MKKICPQCEYVNLYEAKTCAQCGYDLTAQRRYKLCPNCGKQFDLVADVCDECGDKLIVRGDLVAQVYDETQKEEVPAWVRVVASFLPIIGYIIAAVYCICAVEDKKMERETAKHLLLTSLGIQLLVIVVILFIVGLCLGNGWALLRKIHEGGNLST